MSLGLCLFGQLRSPTAHATNPTLRAVLLVIVVGMVTWTAERSANAQHRSRQAQAGMRVGVVCAQVAWQPHGDALACGQSSDDPPPGVAIFGPDGSRRVLVERLRSFPFAWRPDGQELVGLAREPTWDPVRIAVVAPDGSNLRLLTPPITNVQSLAWRPDGSEIWYSAGREMFSIDLTGGPPRDRGVGMEPTWSPDGTHVAFSRFERPNHEVWLADAQGANEQRVLQSATRVPRLRWSPNGAWLGVGGWDSARDEGYLSIAPMTNGTLGAFTTFYGVSGDEFSWSPDETEIVTTAVDGPQPRNPSLTRRYRLVAVHVPDGAIRTVVRPDRGTCRAWIPAWSERGIAFAHDCSSTTAPTNSLRTLLPGQVSPAGRP